MPVDPLFDPYLVFEVKHKHCAVIHIRVIRGRRITKGWAGDLLDTPDPYLILNLVNSPQPWRKTTVKDNDINPDWDETFSFWVDPEEEHILEMCLMDANSLCADEHLSSKSLPLKPLPIGRRFKTTIGFNETSEIDFEIWGEIQDNPDLRYSLSLCNEEKHFIDRRKRKILKSLKDHYGFAAPRNYKEVPVIAVIGSGGGFRAMTAYSGAISALAQLGILNMSTYVGGLSGSAWYLSQLYSHPEWPNISPGEQRNEIKNNVDHSFLWLFRSHGFHFAKEVWKKRTRGEPVSFTDLFGHLVGNTLISDRLETKLSDQKNKINDGQCPMPLYTCLHVKKAVSAMIFHEWMEFSPYEIGLPKYGTYLKPEQFACKFFMGSIIRHFPEPPLHFLQGIWGSAFCIQFKRLLQDDKKIPSNVASLDERDSFEQELKKDLSFYDQEDSESSEDEVAEEKGTQENATTGGLQRKRSKSTKMKNKTFWESILTRVLDSKMFQTIELRAAQVFNFMRGLCLNNVLPFSPFTKSQEEEDENNKATFGSIFELHPTHVKKLYVVDSGLSFNSPYPVILRPPREVDLIISFDFSARATDDAEPFKELLLAAKWAELNKVPFPPIDPDIMKKEGLKECYVFRHPWDPNCPIVIHFVLVNINFRREIIPGVPRTTDEELKFGNFSIFDDPNKPYSTFKFTYTHLEFDRLSKLMEYNTLLYQDTIFSNISVCIKRRRKFSIRRPCSQKDLSRLSLNSRTQVEKLKEYIAMAEKLAAEAEQEEKKNGKRRPLLKQQEIDKSRPTSSPVHFDKDNEEPLECRLQRSTVSLRPNKIHQMNAALSQVQEKSEEEEENSTEEKVKKVNLSRSKPVTSSHRPSREIILNGFSIIEEEAETVAYNPGRRRSRDDSDVNFYMRTAPISRLQKMDNFDKTLSNADSMDGRLSGRASPNPTGITTENGASHVKNAVPVSDKDSLNDFLEKADRVTDL